MKEATIIYPHQLFKSNPALKAGNLVYLVEEPLFLTEFPIHRQKLLLHRLSMRAYKPLLEKLGFEVVYLSIQELKNTESVFAILAKSGIKKIHIVDTTDNWLEKRISDFSQKHGLELVRYESPLFILTASEANERYLASKKQMARFYKTLRQDKKIMLNDNGTPLGDKWSFDEDNRKKLPKNIKLPTDISFYNNSDVAEAQTWLKSVSGEHYGESNFWLPYTHSEARTWLDSFLAERFENFGDYEDALTDTHTRLFHSTISPLLNIGLLTPLEVIDAAIKYSRAKEVSLNNLEGFVRQIIGWREFIRASYETEGSSMRTKNFWQHARPLPSTFWDGTTGVFPIDIAIKNSLKYGYGHHIERLMVMGNFMLLTKTKPDEVYRWFMAMYVDAYDWVMVPNVYGMSQFADGGSFATKPYISGSNYLKKMSDYPAGDWEEIWTSLYWKFIADNSEFFKSNHRLSMMPRLLEKMEATKKLHYKKTAEDYLSKDV